MGDSCCRPGLARWRCRKGPPACQLLSKQFVTSGGAAAANHSVSADQHRGLRISDAQGRGHFHRLNPRISVQAGKHRGSSLHGAQRGITNGRKRRARGGREGVRETVPPEPASRVRLGLRPAGQRSARLPSACRRGSPDTPRNPRRAENPAEPWSPPLRRPRSCEGFSTS